MRRPAALPLLRRCVHIHPRRLVHAPMHAPYVAANKESARAEADCSTSLPKRRRRLASHSPAPLHDARHPAPSRVPDDDPQPGIRRSGLEPSAPSRAHIPRHLVLPALPPHVLDPTFERSVTLIVSPQQHLSTGNLDAYLRQFPAEYTPPVLIAGGVFVLPDEPDCVVLLGPCTAGCRWPPTLPVPPIGGYVELFRKSAATRLRTLAWNLSRFDQGAGACPGHTVCVDHGTRKRFGMHMFGYSRKHARYTSLYSGKQPYTLTRALCTRSPPTSTAPPRRRPRIRLEQHTTTPALS